MNDEAARESWTCKEALLRLNEYLEKVRQAVQSLVQEGRVLPIEGKKAALSLARSRQIAESLDAEQEIGETTLATVLGFSAEERVRTMNEDRQPPEMPANEEAAIESAIQFSKQLRRLESGIVAKGLQIRGERAARLPRVDLVAQYGLFAKFNNYEDFFRKFERHNATIGVAIRFPLFNLSQKARAAGADAEALKARREAESVKRQVTSEQQRLQGIVRQLAATREVTRLEYELARGETETASARVQNRTKVGGRALAWVM